jgi:hypothetical protein
MSQAVVEQRQASRDGGRARAARVGAVVAILTMALVYYGAYGDAKASSSQKSGVPFLVIIVAVLAAIIYGLLTPIALRRAEAPAASGSRWAVGMAVVSFLSLAVFWTGLPVVLGPAAAMVGRTGRDATGGSKAYSIAWGLGLFAAVAAVAVTIIGNTTGGH